MNSGISDWKAPPHLRTDQAMTVGRAGTGVPGGPGGLGNPLRMEPKSTGKVQDRAPKGSLSSSKLAGREGRRRGTRRAKKLHTALANVPQPGPWGWRILANQEQPSPQGKEDTPRSQRKGTGGAVATQKLLRRPDSGLSAPKLKQLEPGGSGRLGWRGSLAPRGAC